jgi:Cdc6-like AAA superfamily ATPase
MRPPGAIREFVEEAVGGAAGDADAAPCLYVAGVPGTGKTACVHEVIRTLQQTASTPHFRFVYINALYLPSPVHLYPKLLEALQGAVPNGAAQTQPCVSTSPVRCYSECHKTLPRRARDAGCQTQVQHAGCHMQGIAAA